MSYDLYFVAPPNCASSDFFLHFAARSDFSVNATEVHYENEDTGVYFSFALESCTSDPSNTERSDVWASFRLNLCRPRSFAREAAIELEAFVKRFKCRVIDPQNDDNEPCDFTAEDFLAAWECSTSAISQTLETPLKKDALILRPADELARIWSWNYGRRRLQDDLGEDIFVPKIGFYKWEERLFTGTVWTDGMPIVLPETDVVLIFRHELAPRTWFRRRPSFAIVPWREAFAKFDPGRNEVQPLPHYFANFESTPRELAKWIKSLPKAQGIEIVAMDRVFDDDDCERNGQGAV